MAIRNDGIPRAGRPAPADPARSTPAAIAPAEFHPRLISGRFTDAEELAGYLVAAQLVAGRDVLDVARGGAWDAAPLNRAAPRRCLRVDVGGSGAPAAPGRPGIAGAVVSSLEALDVPTGSFDVAVCLRATGLVRDPERALDELRRVLRPSGLLVVSAPNPLAHTPGGRRRTRWYHPDALAGGLRRRFEHVALIRQQSFLATVVGDAGAFDAGGPAEGDLGRVAAGPDGDPIGVLALASDAELPEVRTTAVLARPLELRRWHEKLAAYEAAVARAAGLEAQVRDLGDRLAEAERAGARLVSLEAELDAFRTLAQTRAWKLASALRPVAAALRSARRRRAVPAAP